MLRKKQIRIAVIAANNMEDVEILLPVNVWKRAGFVVEIIICENRNSFSLHYSGSKLTSPFNLKTTNLIQYDAIYLPGGPGYKSFLSPPVTFKEFNESKLHNSIRKFYESDDKWLIAICASPIVLKVLLNENNEERVADFKFAAYPDNRLLGDYKHDWVDKRYHIDKNIITAQSSGCSYDLAFVVIEQLAGEELALEVAKSINFPWDIVKKLTN